MTSAKVETLLKGIQMQQHILFERKSLLPVVFFPLHWEEEDVIFFVGAQKNLTLEQAEAL